MKKVLLLIIITTSLLVISGCKKQAENWVGFYYPEGQSGPVSAGCDIKEFKIKEECENWANKQAPKTEKSNHYCGYHCNYDDTCQFACINPK